MKIIIVGCGKVGKNIALELAKEDHNLVLIDNDPEVVSSLSNQLDALGVVGDGVSLSVLKNAGVESADVLLAVTSTDEANVLCCLFARKANPSIKTIARVRKPVYSKEIPLIKDELGLTMIINPEMATAREMARLLRFPAATKVETFSRGRVELVSFEVTKENVLTEKKIADVAHIFKKQILIMGIERKGEAFIPRGNSVIEEGDIVSIIAEPAVVTSFFSYMGLLSNPIKSVMIAGGSTIAYYLSTLLLNAGIDIKIIDQDKAKCEELVEKLPKATIIYGDAADKNLLKEEGVEKSDAFVSLTNSDEENVMLSLYVRNVCDAKVITKVNHISMGSVISKLDIGSIVYPKHITADNIITFVRGLAASKSSDIISLYRVLNEQAEVITFKIKQDSKLTKSPLSNLKLIDNLIICSIVRNDQVIIPSGDVQIQVGDTVLVATTNKGIESIEEILQ